MEEFLQKDLGSSLLSIAIIIGWLGIGFVLLRIVTLAIKRILEAVLNLSKNKLSNGVQSESQFSQISY